MAWRRLILGERPRTRSFVAVALAAGSAGLLFVAALLGIALAPHADLPALLLGGDARVGRIAAGALAPLEPRFIASRLGSTAGFPGLEPSVDEAARPATDDGGSAAAAGRAVDRHALTNDSIAAAWPITSVPFTARTRNEGATRTDEDPNDCSAVGGTVWYRYEAARDGRLTAYTMTSDHATAAGAFEETDDGLKLLGCDTDAAGNSLVTFAALAGHAYLFQVTAPVAGGNLVFSLDPTGITRRASVGARSEPPSEFSGNPTVSDDGRYVAFMSSATNLGEGHGPEDEPCPTRATPPPSSWPTACVSVWLRDMERNTNELVAVTDDGTPANGESHHPFISAGGRYVVFESNATNLAATDAIGRDLFVRDRVRGRTERIPAVIDVMPPAPPESGTSHFHGSISADGRYVAFQTPSALVDDDRNGVFDVYVYDRWTQRPERVSVSTEGREAPATDQSTPEPSGGWVTTPDYADLSPYLARTGRYVVFRSNAPGLVPGDGNGTWDTFVRDRREGTTERVSVSSAGAEANGASGYQFRAIPTISDDGRAVVFYSAASNLVDGDGNDVLDVFLHNRVTRSTVRVSEAWEALGQEGQLVFGPSISGDGRFMLWESSTVASYLSTLAEEDADVYRFDVATSTVAAVTVGPNGEDSFGIYGSISGDGYHAVFHSRAANLEGETNGFFNAFVFTAARTR